MRALIAFIAAAMVLAGCQRSSRRFFLDLGPADLKARNLVLSKTTVAPGEVILAGIDVVNDGESATSSFRVGVYASSDGVVDKTDPRLGDGSIGSIGGSPSTISFTFNVTAPTTPGTYFVSAIVDDQSRVAEFDELNNNSNILQLVVQ